MHGKTIEKMETDVIGDRKWGSVNREVKAVSGP
jgi:hypothetical protein